jgi:hypothetical protein
LYPEAVDAQQQNTDSAESGQDKDHASATRKEDARVNWVEMVASEPAHSVPVSSFPNQTTMSALPVGIATTETAPLPQVIARQDGASLLSRV